MVSVKAMPIGGAINRVAASDIEYNRITLPPEFVIILTELQRLIYDYLISGYTHDDIAKMTGRTREAVTCIISGIRNRIKAVVDKMSERDQEIFALYCIGLTREQTAARLGIPANTVRRRLKVVRRFFLEELI